MIEVHHLSIIILCYLKIVWYSFGAVLVQFQISKFSRITKFIKFTKLQITIFSKTNFDEITNLTGPTKFSSLADSGQLKLKRMSQIRFAWIAAKTMLKANTKNTQKHQPRCSLPESAGRWVSLFLGRLDQGLVGHAESTHVNRPKGKATLVP